MSKEAIIIQSFNDVKRQYEYSVKGYDVTESVKILLKRHKEEYDKEKKIFAGIDGYLEAQKEYQSQIAYLEAKLAERNEYFRSFGCEDFNEFKDFISTFMLAPHEEQTLIQELKQQLAEKETEIGFLEGTINSMQEDISYWEQKLAEKEKAVDGLQEINQSLGQTCNNDAKEIERLRELISEKEKENDKLTAKLEQANEIINNPDTLIFQQQELIDNLQSQLAEKDVEIKKLNACVDFYKSYYISFKGKVIDELEKVKEHFINIKTPTLGVIRRYEMVMYIDNQIKELKEGK